VYEPEIRYLATLNNVISALDVTLSRHPKQRYLASRNNVIYILQINEFHPIDENGERRRAYMACLVALYECIEVLENT